MAPKGKRVINTHLSEDLVVALEDYRYVRRFPSRTAAMEFLLRWALERNPEPSAEERQG